VICQQSIAYNLNSFYLIWTNILKVHTHKHAAADRGYSLKRWGYSLVGYQTIPRGIVWGQPDYTRVYFQGGIFPEVTPGSRDEWFMVKNSDIKHETEWPYRTLYNAPSYLKMLITTQIQHSLWWHCTHTISILQSTFQPVG
jgi:hypothetical protein